MFNLMKAPDVLIDAVAECLGRGINLELVMLGEGQFRASLERRVQRLGIAERVKFLGPLPMGQAVYDQLDQADLYVMPSRQEGLPRSVIEAMARGLPCITSNVGGLPELVESQYMVKPDDTSGLAETIAKTISNVEEMKRLVKRSVEIASKYRSDILQERRVKFYCVLRDITQDWLNNRKE
jgi:glycosyltransferase involved in cell wall biosynthesis